MDFNIPQQFLWQLDFTNHKRHKNLNTINYLSENTQYLLRKALSD